MNIINRYVQKKYSSIIFRKFNWGSISTRLSLPIAILGIILVVVAFLFLNKSKEGISNSIVQSKPIKNILDRNIPDKSSYVPEPAHSVLSYENIDSREEIKEVYSTLESTKWSWIDPDNKKEVTWTADQAFEEAKKYLGGDKPRQFEALKMYQRVLDANPPRLLELHVKLSMGSRMMILYNPGLGEKDMYDEAFKWYKLLVHDFNDLGNHTDMMTAKIHLGDLYCWSKYSINELKKASDLCLQVIKVPEKDIIFDDQTEVRLNLENINIAQAPGGRPGSQRPETVNQMYRQRLIEQRQEVLNRYRLVAIETLIRTQYVPGFPLEVYLERLNLLKQERPDDKLYQDTLEAKIQEVTKTLEGSHSEFEGVLKEGIKK